MERVAEERIVDGRRAVREHHIDRGLLQAAWEIPFAARRDCSPIPVRQSQRGERGFVSIAQIATGVSRDDLAGVEPEQFLSPDQSVDPQCMQSTYLKQRQIRAMPR